MTEPSTYDVAVIGYGPTGATAANLLGQLGLKVLVVERDPDVYGRARAISTDEEVMRVWQSVGLADRLQRDMLPDRPLSFVDADGVPFIDLKITSRGAGHPPQQFLYQPAVDHHRRNDQRPQVQDPVPAGQRAPPFSRDRRRQPAADQPDPDPGAAPEHSRRRSRRQTASYQRVKELGFHMALAVGQHTNDKELSYYAMTPSGFEWEVGWNPIVVDEKTWEPTTYQGISIWGHTREGQSIVDKLAQFKTGAQSLLRREDTVKALAGAGVRDN